MLLPVHRRETGDETGAGAATRYSAVCGRRMPGGLRALTPIPPGPLPVPPVPPHGPAPPPGRAHPPRRDKARPPGRTCRRPLTPADAPGGSPRAWALQLQRQHRQRYRCPPPTAAPPPLTCRPAPAAPLPAARPEPRSSGPAPSASPRLPRRAPPIAAGRARWPRPSPVPLSLSRPSGRRRAPIGCRRRGGGVAWGSACSPQRSLVGGGVRRCLLSVRLTGCVRGREQRVQLDK